MDLDLGHREIPDVGSCERGTDACRCGRNQAVGLVECDAFPCECPTPFAGLDTLGDAEGRKAEAIEQTSRVRFFIRE